MSEKMPRKNNKRLSFSLRYQVAENTPDALLLKFINSYPFGQPKELVIQSLRAFWLPFAYHKSGQFSEEDVKEVGQKAIALLTFQSDYIASILGMISPSSSINKSADIPFQNEDEEEDSFFMPSPYLLSDEGFTRDE
jgi:hypothetical protein